MGLENSRRQLLEFSKGSVLPLEKLSEVFGRILRNEFWCRFQADDGFVHFGWDYYMYVGVPLRCPTAEQIASELGRYLEEFISPYHEETESQSNLLRQLPICPKSERFGLVRTSAITRHLGSIDSRSNVLMP